MGKYFPSYLDSYLQCPFKYQCSRDKEIREKHRKPTPALFMGSAVHDALEAFFDISRVPVGERDYERLANLLRRAWAGADLSEWKRKRQQEERKRVFGDDRKLERSWGQKALNILYRYFLITDTTVVPFTAEQFHEARLAEGIVLAGKIDRIDRLEDGSLKVLDYKTGKLPFRKDDESIAEEDLQLSCYAIVVGKKYRVPVTRCSLVFLAHDEELGFAPTDELLVKKAARIEEICRQIEAETEFAPKENELCPWCEYREICPVGEKIAPAGEGVVKEPDVPF
ncbi:MAG: RecB family exonuclease [Planctomycetota bacterium]